jgi:NADH dehydrogenase
MYNNSNFRATSKKPHVVIVGGGFAGLYAAKELGNAPVKVTLIDKRNFHLFQPLLYQVATGSLSPAEICSPLRLIVGRNKNTHVVLDEVVDIKPEQNQVIMREGILNYDHLIIGTGVSHHYFGNEHWEKDAPGLKSIENALDIRRKIFLAFEEAEKLSSPQEKIEWLTFAIVGGGPTGVELAGAIAEIAHKTIRKDFQEIDTTKARILLIEGMNRILPPYAEDLSYKAQTSLEELGVEVLTNRMVTNIDGNNLTIRHNDQEETIRARTILWAAGVKASGLSEVIAERTGVQRDRAGRIMVEPDLSIKYHPNIFIVGDLANFSHQGDKPLPGIAPVAMAEGQYVAKLIQAKAENKILETFKYVDKGSLAVIGDNHAVADLGFIKLSGFLAWFVWVFAHVYYLIEFDNKLVVLLQWGWNYFTRGRGARLITGEISEKNLVSQSFNNEHYSEYSVSQKVEQDKEAVKI